MTRNPAALSHRPAPGQRLWHAWRSRALQRLQGLNRRERLSMALMVMAVLGGLELLWIEPMHHRRVAIEQAAQQQEEAAAQAEQSRLAQQAQDATALQTRLAAVEKALAGHGASRAAEPMQALGAWLDRALTGQAVRLMALRDLEPEPVTLDPAPEADASATTATAPNTTPEKPLHRLRFELQLAGEPAALAQAAQTLAERMAPLRLARVHLARTEAGGVQATLLFVILAPDRAWIRL